MNLAVLICTRDEELHIERCLKSLGGIGRAFVVDSGSQDRTCQIAARCGAVVLRHEWAGYASQKNWGLSKLLCDSFDWVLCLDADEYLTEPLREEIRQVAETADHAGYHVPRRNI